MAESSGDGQITQLIEAIHKLTVTAEQLATSLATMLRTQEEDRLENKERQKKFDAEQEEFRKRQKRWDARDEKFERQEWWLKNPWLQPKELAYLLLVVALVATTVTVRILAMR